MNEYTSEPHTSEQMPESDIEPPEPSLPNSARPGDSLNIQIADEQETLAIDESLIVVAVERVFRDSSYDSGAISIAVVDDPTIHEINRQYLEHDYPTDVLSFVLEDRPPYIEGELVVSTDTASRNAAEYNWQPQHELLLYVIHGALHLVGFRDKQEDEILAMRTAEAKCLRALGIALPENLSRWSDRNENADDLIDGAPLF